MARIEVETHIEAGPRRVWDVLVDWHGWPRWMHAVRRVRVPEAPRTGVGVSLTCTTGAGRGGLAGGALVTTEWEPPRALGIRHRGRLVAGVTAFELTATAHGTRIVWWREIDPPLWALGDAIASVLVVPRATRVARASLASLKRICESTSVRP